MDLTQAFADQAAVARYASETPRRVPGFDDLHRMAGILLAEQASERAEILVLGAGGGLELKAFALAQPGWQFVGVDPSAEMLDLARSVLGSLNDRVELTQGTIDAAPDRLFDGATCLLTLHFLSADDRLHTLRELRRRLKPGAPLLVVHHSSPDEGMLGTWIRRSVRFAGGDRPDDAQVSASTAIMIERLPILSVQEDEALLREAGFADISLFYAAFSFRGWLAA